VPASLNDATSIHHITPLPQRGRGARGEGGPSPSSQLPAALTRSAEKGSDYRSRDNPVPASFNDAASIHHITPLPQRGRGAGGEGRPHLPTSSLPLPHGQRKGEGEWATVMKGILQP